MALPVTYVPKGKSIFKFLSELGEKTTNAWIFMHKSVVHQLFHETDEHGESIDHKIWFSISHEAEDRAEHSIAFIPFDIDSKWHNLKFFDDYEWYFIVMINSNDINFKHSTPCPEEVILLKMEA